MSAHHRPKDLTHKEKNTAKSVSESGFQSVITANKILVDESTLSLLGTVKHNK